MSGEPTITEEDGMVIINSADEAAVLPASAGGMPVTEDEAAAATAAVKEMLGPDQVCRHALGYFLFPFFVL